MTARALALDCGTQSTRATVVDATGTIVAAAKVAHPPSSSEQPGWVEWPVETFWNALVEAVGQIRDSNPDVLGSVDVMVVTTQRASTVVVDEGGLPLRPMISWMDRRRVSRPPSPALRYRVAFALARARTLIDSVVPRCPYYWISENEPDIAARIHKVLLLSTYLHYRLVGRYVDSVASTVGFVPFDARQLTWAEPDSMMANLFQVPRHLLYDLVHPGEVIGRLTDRSASEIGLPVGLPVVASGSDKACETVGAGCRDEGTGSISLGSECTIETTADRFYKIGPVQPSYPAAIPGHYNPEIGLERGFWLLQWFAEEFGHADEREATQMETSTLEVLNRRVEGIDPGSDGLLMHPYWGADPNRPDLRGAVVGFTDAHTRYHVYRALVEGLGFALLEGLQAIERASGKPIERVILTGGGSQSDLICQIMADILGRPVTRPQTHEAASLGAAIVGMVGIGVHPDVATGMEAMVHPTATFVPDPARANRYESLYRQAFKPLTGQLIPTYRRMARLTGVSLPA